MAKKFPRIIIDFPSKRAPVEELIEMREGLKDDLKNTSAGLK